MRLTYDFQYGERYECDLLSVRDVDSAENKPGMYAWYLRLDRHKTDVDSLRAYTRVFTSRALDLKAAGILNEHYEGTLERAPFEIPEHETSSLLINATVMFSPPIYIGISKHVRTRLRQHLTCLEAGLEAYRAKAGEEVESFLPDTAAESESFGRRVAGLLRASEIPEISGLFVKVIYNQQAARAHLVAVESILNRTFGPVGGRR